MSISLAGLKGEADLERIIRMKGGLFLFYVLLIALDRAGKILYMKADFCNALLCIKPSTNTGAAFGILQGYNWLFIAIGLLVILMILSIFYSHRGSMPIRIASTLLFAGISSNLIDRIIYGYVQDFIAFSFMPWFPSFNLADAFNFMGAVMLVIILAAKNELK